MKILFTGCSSFTGYWFAQTLAKAGHSVAGTLTRCLSDYAGIRRERLDLLRNQIQLYPEVRFGTPGFISLIESLGPLDLLCHHAADVTNYNSPDFDAVGAVSNNTHGLRQTLKSLKAAQVRAIVLTGSVFESNEGCGEDPRRAFNPYGLSKALTSQVFEYYAYNAEIRLGKFVIPNPFGPWEEPRFTDYLLKTWKECKAAEVKTPEYVRDNIPVDLLAQCYLSFAEDSIDSGNPFSRLNPSGYVETQGAFALRFAREMQTHLGLECKVQLAKQTDFSQPLIRINSTSARRLGPSWQEDLFWEAAAHFYRQKYSL